MSYAGHRDDPNPRASLTERGLLALAGKARTAAPCPRCIQVKRWALLTDAERAAMGAAPELELPATHTCDNRDLEFWFAAADRAARDDTPRPARPRSFDGYAVGQRTETERQAEAREQRAAKARESMECR